VLGWQRLLDERDAGRKDAADFPLAIALVVLATALTLSLLLWLEPRAAAWFIYLHGSPTLTAAARSNTLFYLFVESWAAVVTAAAVAGLLALCRWRRPSRRLLERLALLVLACDLWHYGSGALQKVPASIYRQPPALAASLMPIRNRIYTQEQIAGERELLWRGGDPESWIARTFVATLSPYAGILWNVPYAFDADFELMLTGWGRKAENILTQELAQPQMAYRYLGVWNVGTILRPLSQAEQVAAEKTPTALPRKQVVNTYVLPRFRFVPRVTFHPSHAAALAAARARGWKVALDEQCVRPGRPASAATYRRPPRLLEVVDKGGRIAARYRSEEGAFLVVATTFDKGWRASVGGKPVAVYPTAACQIGLALPPGEHQILLEYQDPLVGIGAAGTLITLVSGAAALLWTGRRRVTRSKEQSKEKEAIA
jgi:hypothetical protein